MIENCCSETGDTPIGRRVYDDAHEVLLVVRLVQNYNVSKHTPVLSQALQRNLILSFQIEMTNLVTVQCSTPFNIRNFMQGFPLHPNDSWFPAITSLQQAYVCTRNLILCPDQEHWFERYHLIYKYI
ncbi:MAG: hypothetical protein NVSMB44_37910 [Ktedonobacteraceae bacterium]